MPLAIKFENVKNASFDNFHGSKGTKTCPGSQLSKIKLVFLLMFWGPNTPYRRNYKSDSSFSQFSPSYVIQS